MPSGLPRAALVVLFDRDGTLVEDVPYNGDPSQVSPMPMARPMLDRLRAHGLLVGVVTNQSGVARGLLTLDQVDRVNERIEQLLGPIDLWSVCPHAPDDGCPCRKPRPGAIERAAAALGVSPADCVMVGDIGSDVDAARAAGAMAILVPTAATRIDEVAAAPIVAADLRAATSLILEGDVMSTPDDDTRSDELPADDDTLAGEDQYGRRSAGTDEHGRRNTGTAGGPPPPDDPGGNDLSREDERLLD